MKKQIIFIIIPVFNEGYVIADVIHELQECGYKNIIIVDDGSSDTTYSELQKTDVQVLRHRLNRGKGAAVKTGIEGAKLLGAEVVVTFDGDGQHDPKDISNLIQKISKGYDVVLGSRFIHKQDIPLVKRIANYIANCITFVVYGIWVTDSQAGLRAYGKNALEILNTVSDRYEFDTEVLWDIRKNYLKVAEIPMHVRYTKYSQEKANRQNITSAIVTMLKVIVKG